MIINWSQVKPSQYNSNKNVSPWFFHNLHICNEYYVKNRVPLHFSVSASWFRCICLTFVTTHIYTIFLTSKNNKGLPILFLTNHKIKNKWYNGMKFHPHFLLQLFRIKLFSLCENVQWSHWCHSKLSYIVLKKLTSKEHSKNCCRINNCFTAVPQKRANRFVREITSKAVEDVHI